MPSARTVAAAICALFACLAMLCAPAAAAERSKAAPSDSAVAADAGSTGTLSPSDMRSATPLPGPERQVGGTGAGFAQASQARPRGSFEVTGERAPGLRTHGKVFFRIPDDSRLYSCSGTVVRSAGANLVFTAGHCVYDHPSGKFHENVVFIPAYREEEAPFGQFSADTLYAPAGWVEGGDTSYDIGLIALTERAQDAVGGRRVAFNQPPERTDRFTLFGYPAAPSAKYDGSRPIGCDSALLRIMRLGDPPSLVAAPCDMRQGSSGGGWITPAGFLISVVSHGYCDSDPNSCNFLLGPYFGGAALRLYRTAGATEPIELQFLRAPRTVPRLRRGAFRYAVNASTPVGFECRLNRGPVRRCRTAIRLPRLEAGRHVLRVRATDQTGRRAMIGHSFRVVGR